MGASIRDDVQAVLRGDGHAIATLYEQFAPLLLRRLRARFGHFAGLDPEDLLQDTFLYALGHEGRPLRRFLDRDPASCPTADGLERFLWSAACGLASNRRRSVLRHPTAVLDDGWSPGAVNDGEGPALARDALTRLNDCLAQRGEAHVLYFQLRYLDGLTPAEVTHATGWSRKKTYKLKQSLDEALEECVDRLELQ